MARLVTFAAGILVICVSVADAQARRPIARFPRRNPAAQARNMMNQVKNVLINELKTTKDLLENKVDFDYQGHRVEAISQIDQAIRAINQNGKPAPKNGNNKGTNAKGKKGSTGSSGSSSGATQKQSDARLRQARQNLATILGQMGARFAQAQTHIKDAIKELDTALKIK